MSDKKSTCISHVTVRTEPVIASREKAQKAKQGKDYNTLKSKIMASLSSTPHLAEISGKQFGFYWITYTYGKRHKTITRSFSPKMRGQLEKTGQHADIGSYIIIVQEDMETEKPMLRMVPQQKANVEKWERMKEAMQERYNLSDDSQFMKMKAIEPMRHVKGAISPEKQGKKK